MHGVAYGVKRAHLRTVEVLKTIAGRFGLTPARFDLMFALRARGGSCDQASLWKDLGVSRTTVSRMLQGLEDEGFVWRTIDRQWDARRRQVTMTEWGLRKFLELLHAAFRTEEVREKFDNIHERGRAFVEEAWDVVMDIANAFKNSAREFYGVDARDEKTIREVDASDFALMKDIRRRETHRAEKQLRPAKPDCQERLDAHAELDENFDDLDDDELAELDELDDYSKFLPWATRGAPRPDAPEG